MVSAEHTRKGVTGKTILLNSHLLWKNKINLLFKSSKISSHVYGNLLLLI